MSSIMRKINIISRAENVFRNDMLRDSSLTACHHSYVLAITRHPGMSQDDLARHMYINKSGVTRHLAHLEAEGYVKRCPSETDKRVLLVYPTEKMLEVSPKVVDILHEWNKYLTEALDEGEVEMLQTLLQKVSSRAAEYVEQREVRAK